MKRRMVVLIVIGLLLTSLACSVFPRKGGGTAPASGDFQIKVVNNSPDEICYVLISTSDSDMWSEDLLGGEETVLPGGNKTFTAPAGEHDVQLESCDEVVMGTGWFIASKTTLTVGESRATSRLLVDNTSATEVCYVFISSSSGGDWGDDLMGSNETIMPDRMRVFYVRPGTYDLMVRDCDDEPLAEEYEIDLTSDTTWTLENN